MTLIVLSINITALHMRCRLRSLSFVENLEHNKFIEKSQLIELESTNSSSRMEISTFKYAKIEISLQMRKQIKDIKITSWLVADQTLPVGWKYCIFKSKHKTLQFFLHMSQVLKYALFFFFIHLFFLWASIHKEKLSPMVLQRRGYCAVLT